MANIINIQSNKMDSFIQQVKEHVERVNEHVEKLNYLNDRREKNIQILNNRIDEIRREKIKR